MANFNPIGQNLRGKTVTFTFKNIESYPSTSNMIYLVEVLGGETSYQPIYVAASLSQTNDDGTGYYYYDSVYINGGENYLSVDSCDLSPITVDIPDDQDYYLLVFFFYYYIVYIRLCQSILM